MSQKTQDISEELRDICRTHTGTIRSAVAEEALNYDDPQGFFENLLQHGCISGMVSSLIYYTDTHAFYDQHYHAIEDLREELEETHGQPLTIKGDLKNHMAWLAFEETAYQLALELGINI